MTSWYDKQLQYSLQYRELWQEVSISIVPTLHEVVYHIIDDFQCSHDPQPIRFKNEITCLLYSVMYVIMWDEVHLVFMAESWHWKPKNSHDNNSFRELLYSQLWNCSASDHVMSSQQMGTCLDFICTTTASGGGSMHDCSLDLNGL